MKKWLFALFSVLLLSGCSLFEVEPIPACAEGYHLEESVCLLNQTSDINIESSDDLLYLYHTFKKKQDLARWNSGIFMFEDAAMEKTGDLTPSAGSDDYSQTNNQVEGVDEMDNVLTDGKFLYVANYDTIQIMLAYTVQDEYNALSMVKEIHLDELLNENEHLYFNGMYVDEDRLLIIGSYYYYDTCDIEYKSDSEDSITDIYLCEWYQSHSATVVFEYSKTDFSLAQRYEFSGYYVGSRKIGDDLYIVTNEYIPFYYIDQEETKVTLDNYLPYYKIGENKQSLSYNEIVYNEGTNPSTFTTFFGLSLDNETISTQVILGEGGYNLYVSTENIYLTSTKWHFNELVLRELDQAITNGDTDFMPKESPYEISTSIIRVAIENGSVGVGAIGDVPGTTLDQFSMDERDGTVRIVTTENNWWWWNFVEDDTIDNRLMILDMDLHILATLDDLGKPGESVQAVRFVGEYAYVVTFLRTDPFYVIDLSNPYEPKKLSELILPGFSDYLQPLNENYMLGIGYGDNDGGTQGLKISLYDVSDKHNAVVADEIIYPYSDNHYIWTSTVYNHKDLLVALNKGFIALPYTENTWGGNANNWWWSYQTGILVLNVDLDEGTISERGKVLHSETNQFDTYVYKSKYIADYLYTISSKYVKVSRIDDPSVVLNELLIGDSIDLEVPGEVVPEEPIFDLDLFSDFLHVENWDEALTYFNQEHYVFVYDASCEDCDKLIDTFNAFIDSDGSIVFLQASLDQSAYPYDALPALYLIDTEGSIISEFTTLDEIIDVLSY
jgi:uncharacterized secreted protein with C-terminal beta-propeller domain